MRRISQKKGINRIIDANINRAKEGLRVCEEIARFILNSRNLASGIKKIRHQIDTIVRRLPDSRELFAERDSSQDVGRSIYINELKRKDCHDIFFANFQRVKESMRVLEEFAKLKNIKASVGFKKIRYGLYEFEKKAAGKLTSLCHSR